MTFKVGTVANPNGRPRKKPDPRSAILEELCRKHNGNIEKIVDVLIKKALKGEDRAIKLTLDIFIPKAGTYAPVEKTTTNNNLNVKIAPFLKDFSADDQVALWDMLKRAKQKRPMLVDVSEESK